jgi:nicotinamidase-related amidase
MVPLAAAAIVDFQGHIFVTYDTHFENYMDTAEGKKLPVKHCIKGTPGWELDAAIVRALEGKPYTPVEKLTFGSVTLPELIREAAGEEDFTVTLLGLCTDICVVSNALILKAHFPEREIAVISDCCAGGDTRGSDVNVIDGELYGSQLTLSVAIRNMRKHTGAGIHELIKMVTSTPAKTVGLYRDRGSIEPGKIADLVVLDEALAVKGVILEGNFIRKDF